MKKLTATLCLTIAVLLGSMGMSASADFQKGFTAYFSGDYETALREWKPLAEQGHISAQYGLGLMYRDGNGVPKNYKTAVKWFRLAAKQGRADAQFNLGVMYALGQGVPKDYVRAHMWGNIAAMNGKKKSAKKLLDDFEKKMTPADISTAQKLARKCVRKKYKGCSETVKFWDLEERKGLYYQKSSDVPFTGTSTGKEQWKVKKGKIEGPWVIYHDNGQLWYKGLFMDGNEEGPWFEYHDNGQLGEKGNYKDGKKHGPWVGYYDNGQLKRKGTYKVGKKDGPCVRFKSDGTVIKKWTGTYKNGKKISD